MKIKYKMFSYIKFWLKSSNQHGLHSPFVFSYLTKGLYESNCFSKIKQIDWMLKSVNYFNPNKIYVSENLKTSFEQFELLFTDTFLNSDLIFIKGFSFNEVENVIEQMNSKQLLFVCDNKYNSSFQKQLRSNNKIVLVVDFYVGSLISKRTEQLKQNFFLRL